MKPASRALATIGTGPMQQVLEVALRTIGPFAQRHGYDLVVGDGRSDGRPASWGKALLMRDLVERYERVVWIDSDMVITDASEDLPELQAGEVISLARHVHPPERGVIPNCGLWVVRGGQESAEFLDEVWNQTQFVDHRWWEQAAVMHLMGIDPDVLPASPSGASRWAPGVGSLPPSGTSSIPGRGPRGSERFTSQGCRVASACW